MKKQELTKIALMGLTTGLLASSELAATFVSLPAHRPRTQMNLSLIADADKPGEGNLGYHLMNEDELLLELTSDGTKMYNNLTPEGKRLARVVASQRCNNTNECRGLASCKNDSHDCAGKNTCKGTTICAIGDKNLAVKLVSEKMAKKREQITDNTEKTHKTNK